MRQDSNSMEDKPLVAEGITQIYNFNNPNKDSVTALQNMSFHLDEKDFTVLIGPSGCGKTTMLHIFAGLVTPTEGSVYSSGVPIQGPSTDRAVVFQQFNLFPWRTVRENVSFGLQMTNEPQEVQQQRANTFIKLVGLEGFENNYPRELSGGMQQRVGIARALAVDPKVLLMDEPFGALDAQTRETMQRELLEIWEKDRKTILFVTHDIEEALLLGDRILVMGTSPNTIHTDFEVPFDRPRYGKNIETSEEFIRAKEKLWRTLRDGADERRVLK